MYFLDNLSWGHLLFGEHDWVFAFEIIFRSIIMYIVILVGLRLTGKRGVRQLSIFELVVIIGLGSSAGDPMFYKDVGLVSAIIVFVVVIVAYRLTTYFTGKSKRFEELIEGKTVCLIENGKFSFQAFSKETLAEEEFFSELRNRGISQLGQVERAYLEISGEVSVFFYADKDVKAGLPILPHEFANKHKTIPIDGLYSCIHCGHTEKMKEGVQPVCSVCNKKSWVKASDRKRIT
jgi:uncharacterized membrane protein YcaP (DUF421 family)